MKTICRRSRLVLFLAGAFAATVLSAGDGSIRLYHSRYGSVGLALNNHDRALLRREIHVAMTGVPYGISQQVVVWITLKDGSIVPFTAIPPDEDRPIDQNFVATGLSDDGTITGYQDRKPFSWSETEGLRWLPLLPGWKGAAAKGVATLGNRIAGTATLNPLSPGVGPVAIVWTRDPGVEGGWRVEQIPGENAEVLAISGDGTKVGGALQDRPTVWHLENGVWRQRNLSSEKGVVKDVNDSGDAVGVFRRTQDTAFFCSAKGSITELPWGTERGHGRSIARAINNSGIVVGESSTDDDGSDSFIWSEKDPEPKRLRIDRNGNALLRSKAGNWSKEEWKSAAFTRLIDINEENHILGDAYFKESKKDAHYSGTVFLYKY